MQKFFHFGKFGDFSDFGGFGDSYWLELKTLMKLSNVDIGFSLQNLLLSRFVKICWQFCYCDATIESRNLGHNSYNFKKEIFKFQDFKLVTIIAHEWYLISGVPKAIYMAKIHKFWEILKKHFQIDLLYKSEMVAKHGSLNWGIKLMNFC